ncbi:hypothetical protein SAMN05216188_12761 [Lentzea xinjiangensis]|uniref:Uncharacterized protein n=1 Tax=Lentzea xinjiangensis TaxID=402600 RepID=A0A1H9VQB0_9PSEU|nr:hypothetical protein [Lentzea xinjiangensis]SES23423.1 hypothetical protein SAMN05216188_12761 [Lentzea xinjiangensis]
MVGLVPYLLVLVLVLVLGVCYWRWRPEPPDPAVLARIAETQALFREGSRLLKEDGNWSDRHRARDIFSKLRRVDLGTYLAALSAIVREPALDHGAVVVALKVGRPGSEDVMLEALRRNRQIWLTEHYLNSGSPDLYHGAVKWVARRNCRMSTRPGGLGSAWGQF